CSAGTLARARSPPRRSSDLEAAAGRRAPPHVLDDAGSAVDDDGVGRIERDGLELLAAAGPVGHGEALAEAGVHIRERVGEERGQDRKSTRLNSSHVKISYAV